MRIHSLLAVAALAWAGCVEPDTALRLTIEPGTVPAPASLRLTLAAPGLAPPPRDVAPVSLPGTVVIRGLSSDASPVCVHVDALDTSGTVVGQASTRASLTAHATVTASATLLPPGDDPGCAAPGGDDLAVPGEDSAGVPPGSDLSSPPDLAAVAVCPTGAIFCDDFESADMAQWTMASAIKYQDMGAIGRSTAQHAHGAFSLYAQGSGIPGSNNYIVAEKVFPSAIAPPLAIRANVWTPQPLGSYTMVLTLFDPNNDTFSFGGDNSSEWVVTEDQSASGGGTLDHPSDMVAAGGGAWHCLEIVVDAANNASAFVDGHRLMGPFVRASALQYTAFSVGIARTVVPTGSTVYVDDVAVGPSRLYCP